MAVQGKSRAVGGRKGARRGQGGGVNREVGASARHAHMLPGWPGHRQAEGHRHSDKMQKATRGSLSEPHMPRLPSFLGGRLQKRSSS